MVRQGVVAVILAYAGVTERVNHRNGWVVYHISEPNITYNLFAGPTQKKLPGPKPRLMTIEEIGLHYDPNEGK